MLADLFTVLADLLTQTPPIPPDAYRAIEDQQRLLHGRDLIVGQIALRLIHTLSGIYEQGVPYTTTSSTPAPGIADFVVLLRQIIRVSRPLPIHATLWQAIREQAEQSGLVGSRLINGAIATETIEVVAHPWISEWLPDANQIDQLVARRDNDTFPGDGMLFAMSQAAGLHWTTYQSGAQKAAVDCWAFAAPGSTTLVTLPTGGGKSLCTLLPPWYASRGGKRSYGTTLVVVPTVALALDQEKQAERFFQKALGELSKPISRTGDTSAEERRTIEAGLRDGRIPILYTSPESLLGSRLYDVCLNAARDGLITRFVIDEAHLIETWGAGFRAEFQLLAAYRKKLLAATNGQLRTLLLSATITDNSRVTLEKLFAESGKLVVIQANRLRPEIGYWFHLSNTEATRRRRVLEALQYLPRPLILYVTRPDQARSWVKDLNNHGYQRVASFSGETEANERRRLINAWDKNAIDIMVATSAFGLGVDKSNVRAVVHATVPENIDRFYQEVGRSGRDGYSAVSLICATRDYHEEKDDFKLAFSLMPKVITVEKAISRWQGMLAQANTEGDIRWIDRDARPFGRPDMQQNERNRDWNDHLLLLMQRAGLIEIVDAPPPRSNETGGNTALLPIRILDADIFNLPGFALTKIEQHREDERENAFRLAKDMADLVSSYAGKPAVDCLAYRFADLYEDVQHACGGCPACRQAGEEPYSAPLRFDVTYPITLRNSVHNDVAIDPGFQTKLGAWRTLTLTWSGARNLSSLNHAFTLLPELVKLGFRQIIYPFEMLDDHALRDRLIKELAQPDPQRPTHFHRLIPDRWITEEDYPILPLGTVILYAPDDRRADRLFRKMKQLCEQGLYLPGTVHIVHERLSLSSAGKSFVEHVNGLTESLERFQELIKSQQQSVEYF